MDEEPLLCSPLNSFAYRLIYDIEVYLRLVIRLELRAKYCDKWKGGFPPDLTKEANRRYVQEAELGVLDAHPNSVLSYLQLSELKSLILDTWMWSDVFKAHWGAKEIVESDFKKLIAARNKVAHFRTITQRDVRNVQRFAEDLEDRTSKYRDIRRFSRWEDLARDGEPECRIASAFYLARHNGALSELSRREYKGHVSIRISADSQYIDFEVLNSFVSNNEKYVTFFSVSDQSATFEIPQGIDDDGLRKICGSLSSFFVESPDMASKASYEGDLLTLESCLSPRNNFPSEFEYRY